MMNFLEDLGRFIELLVGLLLGIFLTWPFTLPMRCIGLERAAQDWEDTVWDKLDDWFL